MGETMRGQEAIGGDAQGGVVMKAPPVSPFVVGQAKLLLEFPVIALDAPAHLGDEDQLIERGIRRWP